MSEETNINVLYVDDEENNLIAFRASFRRHFNVFTAISADEGKKILNNNEIHVLITDQRMPRMTGDELLSRVVDATTVGIMVSGFADLPAVVRAINEGKVFAYVTKPWNAEDLRFKVAKGVEHFRLAGRPADQRLGIRPL